MVQGWAAAAGARHRALPRLGDVLAGRANNFDLIRLGAAALVIYGHSFFEAPDGEAQDLVQRAFGGAEYSGSVAVYIFFLVSGLLITASMEKHRSAAAFLVLRFARIWPGFVVCSAVLLFTVVPLASGLGLHATAREAGACLRQNALFFLRDVCIGFTGAFPATPMPGAIGFSWWTLPAEVHCYAVVLGLGLLLRGRFTGTRGEAVRFVAATLACCALFLLAVAHPPAGAFAAEFTVMGGYSTYPVLFFFAGMLLYAGRHRVVIDGAAAVALAAVALALPQPNPLVYPALGYGVLALAAAPALRPLKPRHDLSYGLYVYGAALQQVVATALGPRSAIVGFAVSLAVALPVAYLSWRLVEAPAIGLGRVLARRLGPATRARALETGEITR